MPPHQGVHSSAGCGAPLSTASRLSKASGVAGSCDFDTNDTDASALESFWHSDAFNVKTYLSSYSYDPSAFDPDACDSKIGSSDDSSRGGADALVHTELGRAENTGSFSRFGGASLAEGLLSLLPLSRALNTRVSPLDIPVAESSRTRRGKTLEKSLADADREALLKIGSVLVTLDDSSSLAPFKGSSATVSRQSLVRKEAEVWL